MISCLLPWVVKLIQKGEKECIQEEQILSLKGGKNENGKMVPLKVYEISFRLIIIFSAIIRINFTPGVILYFDPPKK